MVMGVRGMALREQRAQTVLAIAFNTPPRHTKRPGVVQGRGLANAFFRICDNCVDEVAKISFTDSYFHEHAVSMSMVDGARNALLGYLYQLLGTAAVSIREVASAADAWAH